MPNLTPSPHPKKVYLPNCLHAARPPHSLSFPRHRRPRHLIPHIPNPNNPTDPGSGTLTRVTVPFV